MLRGGGTAREDIQRMLALVDSAALNLMSQEIFFRKIVARFVKEKSAGIDRRSHEVWPAQRHHSPQWKQSGHFRTRHSRAARPAFPASATPTALRQSPSGQNMRKPDFG